MSADASSREKNKKYVLVVDADAVTRFSTCILLQRFGYYIFTASTLQEAIAFMKETPPAALVIDAELVPQGLFSELKKDERLSKIPFLVLSSPGTPAQGHGEQDGMQVRHLRKPLHVEEFYRAVHAVVEKGTRRNIRVETLLTATLEGEAAEYEGVVTELSQEGLFFQGLASLPKNTRVPICFQLKGRTILLEAIVLYSTSEGGAPSLKPGMGMKFGKISPVDQDLIKTFVIDKVKEGTVRQRAYH